MERNVMVTFEGWCADLFLCDDGRLGLTVEKAPHHEDNKSVDIFVAEIDGGLAVTSPDALQDPGAQLREKALHSLMQSGVSVEAAFELLLHALDKKLAQQQGCGWQRCIDHVSTLRGYFTEHGTTSEQDDKLHEWGFIN